MVGLTGRKRVDSCTSAVRKPCNRVVWCTCQSVKFFCGKCKHSRLNTRFFKTLGWRISGFPLHVFFSTGTFVPFKILYSLRSSKKRRTGYNTLLDMIFNNKYLKFYLYLFFFPCKTPTNLLILHSKKS